MLSTKKMKEKKIKFSKNQDETIKKTVIRYLNNSILWRKRIQEIDSKLYFSEKHGEMIGKALEQFFKDIFSAPPHPTPRTVSHYHFFSDLGKLLRKQEPVLPGLAAWFIAN